MKKEQGSDRICQIVSILMLVLSLCLWFHPAAYSKEYIGGFASAEYMFLQAGDYVLEITYEEAPENCRVIVYSPALVDEWNQQGVVFAEENLPGAEGVISLPFHLDQGTESVRILQNAGEEFRIFDTVRLQSVQLTDRDNYFLSICLMMLAAVVFFFGRRLADAKYRTPMLLLFLGLAASLPLMNDSLKWGHDIEFHLARIEGLYQGLRSGAFPVRVNPVQLEGFGYLSAAMYPQLFLYPAACLRFLGVSTMLCYKLLLAGTCIATAFVTYYSVRGITKSGKTGLLASVLYTFSAYRLIGLYTGATLGETMAMTFFPLAAWGIYEVLWGNERKWPLLALGVTGVMQCHILSTEMCVLFLGMVSLLWLIAGDKEKWGRRISRCFLAAGVAILWNLGLLIPILFYSRENLQVYGIQSDLSLSAAYLSQMFTFFPEPAGNNQVSGYTRGEMPISVGGILLVCAVLLVAALLHRENGEEREYSPMERTGGVCLGLGGMAVLLASDLFPWQQVQRIAWLDRLATPLQFVWRFLAPASFFLCVAGAVGMTVFRKRFAGTDWLVPVVMAVLACSTMYYFDRVSYVLEDMPDKMLTAGIDDSGSAHYLYEESDLWDFVRENALIQCLGGSNIVCSEYHKDGTFLSVRIIPKQVEEGDKLIFPLYGYTGYQVLVNGSPVEWERINSRIACDVPLGESLVEIRYRGHWTFAAADAVSLLSAAAGIISAVRKKYLSGREDNHEYDERDRYPGEAA